MLLLGNSQAKNSSAKFSSADLLPEFRSQCKQARGLGWNIDLDHSAVMHL